MEKRRGWIIIDLFSAVMIIHLLLIHIDKSRNLGLYYLFVDGSIDYEYALRSLSVSTIIKGLAFIGIVTTLHFSVFKKVKVLIHSNDKKIFDPDDPKLRLVSELCLCMLLVLYCSFAAYQIRSKYDTQKEILKTRDLLKSQRTVIHAGGDVAINGVDYSYTNSLEAVTACYDAGNRVAEIDFMMTSDHKLICAHNGEEEDGVWAAGSDFIEAPTEKEFKRGTVFGALTPMSLEDLAEFMRLNDDFYIVTDICKR